MIRQQWYQQVQLWETQWAYGGGTGNASYAYFGGGYDSADPISHTARLDYANDTATALSKGKLSSARFNLDAVSSRGNGQSSPTTKTVDKGADGYTVAGSLGPAYGYVMAGFPPTQNNSSVDRIDFSNDTATASNRAAILIDKRNFSNSEVTSITHGYLVGGQLASGSPSVTSSVEKLIMQMTQHQQQLLEN